jgi:hypothetical protein
MKLLLEQKWTNGNLPISWCLNEKHEKKLEDENRESFVIIDVIPEGQRHQLYCKYIPVISKQEVLI